MTRNCQTLRLMISVSPSAAPPPTNTNTKYAQRLRKHHVNTYVLKNKKIKILKMGRVCCWLPIGGGCGVIRYATTILHAQICNFKVLFRHFVALYVYFIILDIKRAETPKNGRLLYVLLWRSLSRRSGELSEGRKACTMYIICIHTKTHTHF